MINCILECSRISLLTGKHFMAYCWVLIMFLVYPFTPNLPSCFLQNNHIKNRETIITITVLSQYSQNTSVNHVDLISSMRKFVTLIKRWILCSGNQSSVEEDTSEYHPVPSDQPTSLPQPHRTAQCTRFGISADCTLTSSNMEAMYDIEEDLTVVAERAANSAAVTAELLDTLLEMIDSGPEMSAYVHENPLHNRVELE